jgi:OmcA/MtrC family decaheme c-type cytochrome
MARRPIQTLIASILLGMLVACGGGGGGDRSPGVEPGPPPPGGPVDPLPPTQPNPVAFADAGQLFATITDAGIEGGRAVVDFQLTDGNNVAITDLEIGNLRFVLAKLQSSPLGNLTGTWQSYINRIERAGAVGPGTEDRLHAYYEREGELTNNGDGSYRYRYATDVNALPDDVLEQADAEGLNLSYEPGRTHRVAIQFDGNPNDTANPWFDWVPETGATGSVFSMDISATANCNRCHDPLGIHGGNRREIAYCVTCHNTGSTDANSGNTVDMKNMIHKIHAGASLPSVQEGTPYILYGFRNSPNDFSNLRYPQDIRNCVNCHAGSSTGAGLEDTLQLTAQGDNWAHVPSKAACGSCHDTSRHVTGQDEARCASCHAEGGFAGSIADSHRMLVEETSDMFLPQIVAIDNGMPGQTPVVTFRLTNPQTDDDYDILNDPVFIGASLNLRMSWSTSDFHNTGNGSETASSVAASAIANSTDNGDGSYSVTMPIAIPDGSEPPGVAATGSGAIVFEGRLSVDTDGDGSNETVPVRNVHEFFAIDEADGRPVDRREIVGLDQCNACHASLSLHGGNRSNNIESCASCHNPRNTDLEVRGGAENPPDGKKEESVDFKTMVHGIHAAGFRENPLVVIGFRSSINVFDEEHVHYPGNIGNCTTCHTGDSFTLPLTAGVLGTTVDTGADLEDPADDTVVSPATAVCASCHDDGVAAAHMESNGGSFATSQRALDEGEVVEQCSLCHGPGRTADVAEVHPL